MQQPNVELQRELKGCCITVPIIYLSAQRLSHPYSHHTEPEHLNIENRGREENHEINAGMEETQNFRKQNVAM